MIFRPARRVNGDNSYLTGRCLESGKASIAQQGFRRAVSTDVVAVRELVRTAYAKWVPLIGREPRPMTADYERAVNDHIIDLYERDGRLVGLIEMIPMPSHLLVENIAVLPDSQGGGIGDLLLGHAESAAKSLRLGELRLFTNAAFASNIAFYARRGFQEFRREPFAAGGMIVFMKKVLPVDPNSLQSGQSN